MQNRSYLIYFEYSKAHEDLQVLMRYLFWVRCLTEYQNRLEFPLRQGGYDDAFISNLIIFYNKLHFVDIVEVIGSSPTNPTIVSILIGCENPIRIFSFAEKCYRISSSCCV